MLDNQPKKTSSREYRLFAFKMFADFGVSIAAPVVLFSLIGQYLDEKYNRSPYITVISFVLAAAVSARIIYRKAKTYGEEYKRMNNAGEIKKE